jgi:hypothetical protein
LPPPPLNSQPGPPQFVAAFSPDGKLIAAVIGDSDAVTVWDTATGEEMNALKVTKGVSTLAFAPDGVHLYAGTGWQAGQPAADGKQEPVAVRRFELKTGKEVQSWKAATTEKRQNLQYLRTDTVALYPLPDKETLLAVEAQVYQVWPPPPGLPGRPNFIPAQRFPTVRAINLAGREKDRTIAVGSGSLDLAPEGKLVGSVVTETADPNKPATVVKVIEVSTGAVRALPVATGFPNSTMDNMRGVTFRPGGADLAVRTGEGTVLVVDAGKLQEVKEAKPEGKKE